MIRIDEVEVYITPDGLGRAAIVRRPDALLCLYLHWRWSAEFTKAHGWKAEGAQDWRQDRTPLPELYRDVTPEAGLYGTLEDARRELRSRRGFEDAVLLQRHSGEVLET
jgi:hypothetical protein